MRTKASLGVLATLVGALSLTAGTYAAGGKVSRPPGVNHKIAALVPAKFRSKGALTVAADATYPPNEFVGSNGHTVVGMDPDLGHALGRVLGLSSSRTRWDSRERPPTEW